MSCRAAESLSSLQSCFVMSSMLRKTGGPCTPEQYSTSANELRSPKTILSLCLLVAFLLFAELAGGQVAPGLPSFVPQDCHEVDCVNLQNGNVTLRAPVASKSGAFPFNFGLVGNFYVYKNGSNWEPAQYTSIGEPAGGLIASLNGILPIWGFPLVYNTPVGAICPGGGGTVEYVNWYLQFANGTIHYFPTTDFTDQQGCFHSSFTDQVIDGSGWTITANASGVATSLHDRSGMALQLNSMRDSNGNVISSSGTPTLTYTDTLGLPVMTEYGGTYTWTDVNGGSPQVTTSTATPTLQSAFGCSGVADYNFAKQLPTIVNYPDGTSLGIQYETTPGHSPNVTGRLGQITLREGGTVSYAYSGGTHNGIDCTYQMPPVLKRTTGDGTTEYDFAPSSSGVTTTVTDNGTNKTIYTFTYSSTNGAAMLTQVKRNQGASTLLTTDVYCYNASSGQPGNCPTATPSLPITEQDVYHTINGMTTSSRTQTEYDKYGNVTYSAQYDFGGTSPVRSTTITYGSCSASCTGASPTISAVGSNVNNKPGRVVTTQSGNTVAESRFTYDSKGNLLTAYMWTGSSWLSNATANSYNSNGTLATSYDLANNPTTYLYNGTGGCDNLFPTSVSKGGLTTSSTWNCTGGVKLTDVDANSPPNTTTYCYAAGSTCSGAADPYWRVVSVTDPLGSIVYKTYPTGSSPDTASSSFTFNSGNSINSTTITTDSYGRPINSQTAQSPSGSNYDTLSTSYSWSTTYRAVATSQVCSTTSSSNCTTVHTGNVDPLGRLYTASTSSNATLTHTYTQNDDLAVLGPPPTAENVKQVQTEYDGLGRVSKVCHIGTTPSTGSGTACNQHTGSASGVTDTYSYAAGTGWTQISITRGSQTRRQTFDALGRMTQKVTPEGGTWNYYYDAVASACGRGAASAGNLTCSTDPNGNTVVYVYDSLNRLTDVGSGPTTGSTACKRFRYDNTSGILGSVPTGITLANQYGRIAEAETDDCIWPVTAGHQLTDEWFAFDKDGRKTDLWQRPYAGLYYHSIATFFENGAVKTLQLANPSLYTLTYALDGEGRWYSLTDSTSGQNLVSKATYYPAANPAVVSLTGTTPDNDAYTFDANTGRMTQYVFTVGNTPKTLKGVLNWNPNGTLGSLATTDGFNAGGSLTCLSNSAGALGYGYDDWGRLNEFDCGSGNWGQQYAYDTNDNLTKTVLSGRTGTSWNPGYSSSTNQCTGCSFDSDGDTTADGSGSNYWGWNEFAKMKWWNTSSIAPTCGTSGKCLVYDAFGRIVQYSNGVDWYDVWITQLGSTTTMTGSTIDFSYWPAPGGRGRVEINSSTSGYNYLHGDWLGNARLLSSVANNTEYRDSAYTPYGEQFATYGVTQSYYQRFAGMTGDFNNGVQWETPNRELSIVGRWLSPDPAGSGWNQYAYTTNPNSFVDPSGLVKSDCIWTGGCGAPCNALCSGGGGGGGGNYGGGPGGCSLDGAPVDCGSLFGVGGLGGNGVEGCPNNVCSGFNSSGQYFEFVAGAGGATGYVTLSDILQGISEWNGSFYTSSQLDNMISALVESQKEALADAISNASSSADGSNWDDIYKSLTYNGIEGGHADFSWNWVGDPSENPDPTLAATANWPSGGCVFSCRYGFMDQIHLNNNAFHLDTVGANWAFPLGAMLHGLIDYGFGNINPGIPMLP